MGGSVSGWSVAIRGRAGAVWYAMPVFRALRVLVGSSMKPGRRVTGGMLVVTHAFSSVLL